MRGGGKAVENKFKKTLLEAVDYGLLVLGETVRQAIYSHIERNYKVKREEVPERLEAFHKALEGVLGAGAKVVERLIAKNLYQRLNLNFIEHEDWTLADYIRDAEKLIGVD